jgi:hypothetical protein
MFVRTLMAPNPNSQLDRTNWFAIDFDAQPARVIATSLVVIQVALFLIGRAIDLATQSAVAYGFFATMLRFATLVFTDAVRVRMPIRRAAFWAGAVTFGMIFGAIPYAQWRARLTRTGR